MTDDSIDFWFAVGSTYSYLAIGRLEAVGKASGISFNWRPFSVRVLMKEMDNIPFATKPVKAAYMWRDIERRATMYGLPMRRPVPYPLKAFDLANRVAVLAAEEGWCPAYAKAAYRRWFGEGLEPGSEPSLTDALSEIGQDPARVIAAANGDGVGAAKQAATDEARRLGVFGAPTFVVDGELFWGDDRLDDAIAWRRHGRLG